MTVRTWSRTASVVAIVAMAAALGTTTAALVAEPRNEAQTAVRAENLVHVMRPAGIR